jgi:dipeptidyl-peptidase-4
MTRSILLLFLFASVSFGQIQELDFATATSRDFYPQQATHVGFSDAQTLTWVEPDNPHAMMFYRSGKRDTLFTIVTLNRLGNEAGFTPQERIPAGKWIAPGKYRFFVDNEVWVFTPASGELQLSVAFPATADRYAFSPQGNAVVYALEQNIYLVEGQNRAKRITADGGGDVDYGNYVHQREFGIEKGIFWAPNGRAFAFYREDASPVNKYPHTDFSQRPAREAAAMYPMAGLANTHVSIWVYHLASGQLLRLATGQPLDQYLTNISWTENSEKIAVAQVNRKQDQNRLLLYDAENGRLLKELMVEEDQKYIEPEVPAFFLPGEKFIWTSRKDGWRHVYLFDGDGVGRQLTKGSWEITDFYRQFSSAETVYLRTTKDGPLESTLHTISLPEGNVSRLGRKNGVNSLLSASQAGLLAVRHSSAVNPGVLELYNHAGDFLATIYEAKNPLANLRLPRVAIDTVIAADGQSKLYRRVIYPPDFDQQKQYPLLLYVYGGPHAQLIRNSWGMGARGWLHFLAASGYIVLTVDSRGSGNRGLAFEQETFRRLGEVEIADQLYAVREFSSNPFIDASRIGVHGWSYGGYMAAALMLHGEGLFRAGISGAPVTDWSYYETVYTERYMDTPEENPTGYARSSLLDKGKNLQGRLLIIHGSNDKIVMWQHSILLLEALIKSGSLVDYMLYPGHGHGIRGADREHLYRTMTRYLDDHLR